MTFNADSVPALIERASREVESGLLPAAQMALAYEGEIVVSEAFGACTTTNRFQTYSAVKPTVSLTALELAHAGAFDLYGPVADVLPDFGANGKAAITVSQVLLHTGGFPIAPFPPEKWTDRDQRLEVYGGWRVSWEPGTRFVYHPVNAHWVVADLIQQVTGQHYAEAIDERIHAPLGQRRWLSVPGSEQGDIRAAVSVGVEPDLAALAAKYGLEEIPDLGVTSASLLPLSEPQHVELGTPGAGGVVRAEDLVLFYQAVLHNPDHWLSSSVRAEAMVVRQSHPDWLGTPANRSHVFTLAGDDGLANMRGHGHGASPKTFGHGGAKGQIAFGDPASGISFAFLTNGLDRDDFANARRSIGIATKALACGLAD